LILAYENGYKVWKETAKREMAKENGEVVITHVDSSGDRENEEKEVVAETEDFVQTYKFTSNSRGSKKGEGWSPAGLRLYNELFDAIAQQRRDSTLGEEFELDFMIHDEGDSEAGGEPARNDWANRDEYEGVVVAQHAHV